MEAKDKIKPACYKMIKLLGKGAFGKAYLVQAESNKKFAVIKQIDVGSINTKAKRLKAMQVS